MSPPCSTVSSAPTMSSRPSSSSGRCAPPSGGPVVDFCQCPFTMPRVQSGARALFLNQLGCPDGSRMLSKKQLAVACGFTVIQTESVRLRDPETTPDEKLLRHLRCPDKPRDPFVAAYASLSESELLLDGWVAYLELPAGTDYCGVAEELIGRVEQFLESVDAGSALGPVKRGLCHCSSLRGELWRTPWGHGAAGFRTGFMNMNRFGERCHLQRLQRVYYSTNTPGTISAATIGSCRRGTRGQIELSVDLGRLPES